MQQQPKNSLHKNRVLIQQKPNGIHAEIETERLFMRSFQDVDFQDCLSLYGDEKLAKHFDHGKARTPTEVKSLIHERNDIFFKNGKPFGLFSIFNKKDMAFIGQVDLLPINELGTAEIGCILHRKYHNQGIALEALNALMIDYVNELKLNWFHSVGFNVEKIVATVHPKNYASQKLVRNLGMTFYKSTERFNAPRLWYFYTPSTIGVLEGQCRK